MSGTGLQLPFRQQLAWLRTPAWPAAAAGLAVLGLLLAFYQVVSGAVLQGELRRAAVASKGEAIWRCNAMASARLRNACLVQLNATPHDEAALHARSIGSGE